MTMLDRLFLPAMAFGLLSPFLAIAVAMVLYGRHAARVEAERRMPGWAYLLAAAAAALIGGFFGMLWGVDFACPAAGNLCGLFGVFGTGPVAGLLAVTLVGLALFLIPPKPKS